MTDAEKAAQKPQDGSGKAGRRSPNYPAITFAEALQKAHVLWEADQRNTMTTEVAAEHMGYSNSKNGSFLGTISAMRKYGLVDYTGGEVRVSEDAHKAFVYPDGAAERMTILRALAMRPAIFGDVMKAYPNGLPSDANLRAKLRLDWGFSSAEAADALIRALRESIRYAQLDASPVTPDNSAQVDPSGGVQVTLNGQTQGASGGPGGKQPVLPKPGTEKHAWKLAEGVWAEVIITGGLNAKTFAKLKKFVDLLDTSDAEEGSE
jgi:hypothetical protein